MPDANKAGKFVGTIAGQQPDIIVGIDQINGAAVDVEHAEDSGLQPQLPLPMKRTRVPINANDSPNALANSCPEENLRYSAPK